MKALFVILYASACAVLLVCFTMIEGLVSYVFGLGVFLLGLRFFRNHPTWGIRIALIVTSIILYFLFAVVFAMIAFIQGWDIPVLEFEQLQNSD